MNIPLAKNTINEKDIDTLIDWLKGHPRLTQGEVTLKFEKMWSDFIGCKHSVFVNSGSSANLLMFYLLIESGVLNTGDNVIIPALSWSTSLAPSMQLGLNPILCDCNMEDLSIDIEHFERLIKEHNPKCLLLVSILGFVPRMDEILQICNKNNITLIEDSCESLGSEFNNKKIGSFGLMSSFSTYFGHHISTIEGGMVCTDDDKISNILKALRSHGWSRDMEQTEQKRLREQYFIDEFNERFTFYYTGFNLRSTDLQSFLGILQLKKIDSIINKRIKNFDIYMKNIDDKFWKPTTIPEGLVSNFAFPIIDEKRNEIVKELEDNGIDSRPILCGSLGRQPYWYKQRGEVFLKNADKIHDYGLYLPNNHEIEEDEIKFICNVVNSVNEKVENDT